MDNARFRALVSALEKSPEALHALLYGDSDDPALANLLDDEMQAFVMSVSPGRRLDLALMKDRNDALAARDAIERCVDSCEASRHGAGGRAPTGWAAECICTTSFTCPGTSCAASAGFGTGGELDQRTSIYGCGPETCATTSCAQTCGPETCTRTCGPTSVGRIPGWRDVHWAAVDCRPDLTCSCTRGTCSITTEDFASICGSTNNQGRFAGQRGLPWVAAGCGPDTTCSCTTGTCGGDTCGGSTCSVTCSGDSCGNTCGDSCGYTTNLERPGALWGSRLPEWQRWR